MAFQNISQKEMHAFLTPLGFRPMQLEGVVELVYGKVFTLEDGDRKVQFSLRIYTAINPSGESRAKGEDAIRLKAFYMFQKEPVAVGRTQKLLRVPTWQKNLQAAINRHFTPENIQKCPRCGEPMSLRKYQGQQFWGCCTYHKTKCSGKPKTAAEIQVERAEVTNPTPRTTGKIYHPKTVNRYRIPEHQISDHQKAVERYFIEQLGNIIMGARAGSGKTTMLKHLASFRKSGETMIYLAFGKKNAKEGAKKLPREVASVTTHSFCNRWLREHYKLPEKGTENKTFRIMEDIYPGMGNKDRRRIRKGAFRLVGLGKNFAIMPGDRDGLAAIMDDYTFELETLAERELVLDITLEVLEKSLPKHGLDYNYDDLLWWPIVLGLEPPRYSVVLADECQDFNACQIELLRRLEARGSRIIAVGDPYQAVFRFRGADSDAYDKLKAMLTTTERGCEELILPTNYRCAKAIIDYVRENTVVKDIEAAPNAIEGCVREDLSYLDILDLIVAEHTAV